METLAEYFKRRDTPEAGSPTGLAMVELLKLEPTITFEEARRLVNEVAASLAGPRVVAARALTQNRVETAA